MKLCNSNTWANTLTFIYIQNVVKTSFICYFVLTAENLIWPVIFLFFSSWWPTREYLFAALPQWRSSISTSITELLLLPKFSNSSSSVTRDKEVCHVIVSWWNHHPLRQSTQRNPFNYVYLLSKFDVSSLSMTRDT